MGSSAAAPTASELVRGNRGGRATRLALIHVAERLFAERGIDAVSASEVLAAADQRNKNAIHYHFGGKDGLVTAIAEHRSSSLHERRAELLADVRRRDAEHDISELAATLVTPLAELLEDDECFFIEFLARYHLDRSRRQLVASVNPRVTRTYRDAYRLLGEATTLPPFALEVRFDIAMDMIFTTLASWRARERSDDADPRARAEMIEHLTTCAAGCFASAEVRQAGSVVDHKSDRP